jgi:hypothetical protein
VSLWERQEVQAVLHEPGEMSGVGREDPRNLTLLEWARELLLDDGEP